MMSKTGALINNPDSEEALEGFVKSLESVLKCIRDVQNAVSTITVVTSAIGVPLRTSGLPQSTSTPKPARELSLPPPQPPSLPSSDKHSSDEAPPRLPSSPPPQGPSSSDDDKGLTNVPVSADTSMWTDDSPPIIPPLQPHLGEDVYQTSSPSDEWMKRYAPESPDHDSTLSSFAPTNPPSLLLPSIIDGRVPPLVDIAADDESQQAIQYPSSLGALSITNPSMAGAQNEHSNMKDKEGTGTFFLFD